MIRGLQGLSADLKFCEGVGKGCALFFAFGQLGLELGGVQQFWTGPVEVLFGFVLLFD